MHSKLKTYGPYVLSAIVGGALSFYALGREDVSTAPVQNAQIKPPKLTSVKGGAPSSSLIETEASKTHETASSGPVACEAECEATLTRLYAESEIDDESYEALSVKIARLAAFLEGDAAGRQKMLELALTTEDQNKRALVVDAFNLLSLKQREELGAEFLKSDNWRIRTDGINLSIEAESLTSDKASSLLKLLTEEPHSHVRATILGTLKRADGLKGDVATLNGLSSILTSDANSNVKSEALLTKLELHENPLDVMPESLTALTSQEPELQLSAIIAFGKIYDNQADDNNAFAQVDHEFIKRSIDDLYKIEITDENKAAMTRLLQEADLFYYRHF